MEILRNISVRNTATKAKEYNLKRKEKYSVSMDQTTKIF